MLATAPRQPDCECRRVGPHSSAVALSHLAVLALALCGCAGQVDHTTNGDSNTGVDSTGDGDTTATGTTGDGDGDSCADTSPRGWFSSLDGVGPTRWFGDEDPDGLLHHLPATEPWVAGMPAPMWDDDFVARPPTMSQCELDELHQFCVDQVNRYRSGELRWSDGTQPDSVTDGLPLAVREPAVETCANELTLGDLVISIYGFSTGTRNKSTGVHLNANNCLERQGYTHGWQRGPLQNSCGMRGGFSYGPNDSQVFFDLGLIKSELSGCLQQMWDEGSSCEVHGQGCNRGHFDVMSARDFTRVACGFAWTADGTIHMTQNFNIAYVDP